MGRRAAGYAAAGVLVLTGTGWLALHRPGTAPASGAASVTGTARVLRTDVTAHDLVTGTLGYLDPVTVVAAAGTGVLTWLPGPATTVGVDQRLYEVDGRPVLLWTGTRPAWRDFGPGMPDGPDVGQLAGNLVALGYAPGLPVTDHFSAVTAAAVRRWQAAHGLPRTGTIPLGQVVFLAGPVRVATVAVPPGTPVRPGLTVLTATSTRKAVTVGLDLARQGTVHPGQRVGLGLPGAGRGSTGTVVSVGPAVVAGGGPAGGAGGAGTGTGTGPGASLPVTIGLDDPAAAGGLDAGTVQVSITTAEHDNVLAVPIDALLAAPGGGYQVVVTGGGARHLVTVHTGLFDETGGVVEVSGDLNAGDTVEVPAR